jgi:hypothetical protein
MARFLAAVIAGVVATVIGGLILNQLQGKGRRRGDLPEAARLVASLPQPFLMLSHHGHTPGVSS